MPERFLLSINRVQNKGARVTFLVPFIIQTSTFLDNIQTSTGISQVIRGTKLLRFLTRSPRIHLWTLAWQALVMTPRWLKQSGSPLASKHVQLTGTSCCERQWREAQDGESSVGTRGREGVSDCGVVSQVSQSWDFNVCLDCPAEKSPDFPRQRVRFQQSHRKFGVLKGLAKVFDITWRNPSSPNNNPMYKIYERIHFRSLGFGKLSYLQ